MTPCSDDIIPWYDEVNSIQSNNYDTLSPEYIEVIMPHNDIMKGMLWPDRCVTEPYGKADL